MISEEVMGWRRLSKRLPVALIACLDSIMDRIVQYQSTDTLDGEPPKRFVSARDPVCEIGLVEEPVMLEDALFRPHRDRAKLIVSFANIVPQDSVCLKIALHGEQRPKRQFSAVEKQTECLGNVIVSWVFQSSGVEHPEVWYHIVDDAGVLEILRLVIIFGPWLVSIVPWI